MANTETQLAQKTTVSLSWILPIYAFVAGVAITAIATGADLIGIAGLFGKNGAWQSKLILSGLIIAAVGAVLDLAFGQRGLLAWLKAIVLDWQGLFKFLTIAVQLGLLLVIMRTCYLEHNAFYEKVMPLVFSGFLIHHLLPRPYRLVFFILLSLAAFISVLGFADSAWLIGLSLLLIGICHLPIAFAARVAILLVAAGALTAARFGYLPVPWTKAVWPILASMLMFRLIIYLYDLKHNQVPSGGTGFTYTLSYFFLLPNIAFPLFPVVDYSTFCQTYYDDEEYRIYQTGIKWMFWGVVHLLIYRYINYYWIIGPEKVHDTGTLVQYLVSNYALIIRISGQFHLIIGILHLFGFNLLRIMDRYFLSTGFTDYWRRVNVYWKEFIQKLFFYPAYCRMRKAGNMAKLVVATSFGFLVTWFFHAYQWFWIRSAFLLSLPDILFWLGIGLLVLANSIYETKYGRKRVLVKGKATLQEIASKTLRAAGVFVVMSLLWSLWISPSVSEWIDLIANAKTSLPDLAMALLLVIAVIGSAMLVNEKWSARSTAAPKPRLAFFRFAMPTAAGIWLLYLLAQPAYSFRLGAPASDLIAELKMDRLNDRDAVLLERGYYEQLYNVPSFNSQLWELYAKKPDDWKPLTETEAVRLTDDLMKYEIVPSYEGSLLDVPFKTNRWGMRDDDYEQTPPPNTYRIALLGASVIMGSGVVHEETFEHLLEQRLNREHAKVKYDKYEILNFSVGGYHIIQEMMLLENKVLAFQPNAIFCFAHTRDENRTADYLGEIADLPIPYSELREIMQRAGLTKKTKHKRALQLLEPFKYEIMSWAYSRMVQICRERNILPIWVCLPSATGRNDSVYATELIRVATEAGFIVLNMTDVYDSGKGAYLQVAPWDTHPNAKGHRLIANRLYDELQKMDKTIPFAFSVSK